MIEWGLAQQPRDGGQESGDLCVVQDLPDGVLAGVVDGLGHGPEAAAVARLCGALISELAGAPLAEIVAGCHVRLRGTRGAAISLAAFDRKGPAWSWLGVGNVAGVLGRAGRTPGAGREFLVPRNGLLGARLPPLAVATLRAMPGDTMILATDGIRSDFADHLNLFGTPQRIADEILARHAVANDDALVLAARFSGRERD